MLAWNTSATSPRTRTPLGQFGSLSGYRLWVKINSRLAALGPPIVPHPTLARMALI